MARMIPPAVHEATASPGEHEIFRRLRDDPGTQDWIVLHSLDIAHHRRQVSGEADFVIIVPGKGVLCLEVKACRHVRRENGLWFYGDAAHPDSRGPFKQASGAMHSIRQHLLSRAPALAPVLFWSAVIFPYLNFSIRADEWHSWQVIDAGQFRTRPIARIVEGVLDRARNFLSQHPAAKWFDAQSLVPTLEQGRAIADLLRPSFEFFESPKSREHRLQEQLRFYTSEQFTALDAMEVNRRVVFCGPAGTGKTVLAVEAARRSAAAGRRVLCVSFNRLLGHWLEEQTADLGSGVVCSTLHRYMLNVVPSCAIRQDAEFWQTDLPLQATEYLLDHPDEATSFDELIVDEAQDLMREEYLDFLDLCLRGGLTSGRWRFFGDFEKQAIYSAARIPLDTFLDAQGKGAPVYSLRTNCRNTPHVAELVHLLAGLTPGYTRVLRPDDRIEPELFYYTSPDDQRKLLVSCLERLYSGGYAGREIVILSPNAEGTCTSAAVTQAPWKERVRPIEASGSGHIGYCTIHAYKGLEAPVIIVTDIDHIDEGSQALFYVAITRAVDRLVLLLSEDARADILRVLAQPASGKRGDRRP